MKKPLFVLFVVGYIIAMIAVLTDEISDDSKPTRNDNVQVVNEYPQTTNPIVPTTRKSLAFTMPSLPRVKVPVYDDDPQEQEECQQELGVDYCDPGDLEEFDYGDER